MVIPVRIRFIYVNWSRSGRLLGLKQKISKLMGLKDGRIRLWNPNLPVPQQSERNRSQSHPDLSRVVEIPLFFFPHLHHRSLNPISFPVRNY